MHKMQKKGLAQKVIYNNSLRTFKHSILLDFLDDDECRKILNGHLMEPEAQAILDRTGYKLVNGLVVFHSNCLFSKEVMKI